MALFVRFLLLACSLVCSTFGAVKCARADAEASTAAKMFAGASDALKFLTELVVPDRPQRPPKKVELIYVGFGRTGSTSFTTALKELGYTPVHDTEIADVADLIDAMFKKTMPMDQFHAEMGNRGFDVPMMSIHTYVEWAANATDTKFILTVRDPRKWAESWLTIVPITWLLDVPPFKWSKVGQQLREFNREVFTRVYTGGHPEGVEDIPTLMAGYDKWVEFVRKTVPQERLLEFDVRDGWEPLCKFLRKPVPSTKFPHVNDRAYQSTIIKIFIGITWVWPLLFALPLLLLLGCIHCCCRGRFADNTKKHL